MKPVTRKRRPRRIGSANQIATKAAAEAFTVGEATAAATGAEASYLNSYLENYSTEEVKRLMKSVLEYRSLTDPTSKTNPDEELSDSWRKGGYPYKHELSQELRKTEV